MVLYVALHQEISLCEPIGLAFGAFTGFMLEYLRQEEISHRPTKNNPITHHFPDSDEEKEGKGELMEDSDSDGELDSLIKL